VGDRLFLLRDGVWTDSRLREGLRTIRVKAYSAAYFQLLPMAAGLASIALQLLLQRVPLSAAPWLGDNGHWVWAVAVL